MTEVITKDYCDDCKGIVGVDYDEKSNTPLPCGRKIFECKCGRLFFLFPRWNEPIKSFEGLKIACCIEAGNGFKGAFFFEDFLRNREIKRGEKILEITKILKKAMRKCKLHVIEDCLEKLRKTHEIELQDLEAARIYQENNKLKKSS